MRTMSRRRFLEAAMGAATVVWLAGCASSEEPATQPEAEATPEAPESDPLAAVANDSGQVLDLDGARVAIYKDAQGNVTKLDPKCPHQGCEVEWNADDKTWDCPCHRSIFEPAGERISGPSASGLKMID